MLVELLITFSDGHRTAKIMTTKPEFTKPFNIEHAKAGAPYGCRDGRDAQVLKWDRNVSDFPLLGVIGKSDDPRTWVSTGASVYGAHGDEYDCDLVMMPLGLVDGKPVFVGDELEQRMTAGWVPEVAQPRWATFPASWTSEFRWPAPAPVYPTFDGSVDMLSIEYNNDMNYRNSLVRVANFALRHAIDAGQVVLPGADRDTARDLAVAQAVKERFKKAFGEGPISRFFDSIDLSAIIAGVAK